MKELEYSHQHHDSAGSTGNQDSKLGAARAEANLLFAAADAAIANIRSGDSLNYLRQSIQIGGQ